MAQSQPAKVLRIGIIEDGKIVQERLVKAGETVSVGDSAKNTFVLPKTSLPAEYPLFVAKGGQYVLSFTEEMKGKISSGGAVVALEKLRNDPSVTKQGGSWRLALTEQDRGKISIDNVTVLFQFVPPPPQQAVKPMQAMDFRPRLLDDDDPVFLGFLAIFTALAAVLMVWVYNTDPPVYTLEQIPDRFTSLILKPPEPKEPPEELVTEDLESDKPDEKVKEEKVEKAEPKEKPKDKIEEAKQREAMKEDVVNKSLLLKMLVTRGESSGGIAEDLWSDSDAGLGDLDAALEGVANVTAGTSDNQALRDGKAVDRSDAGIGDLGDIKTGSTGVGDGPAIQVKPDVSLGGDETVDMAQGEAGAIKKTVQRNFGQLTYCYEQRLRANPTLAGRVEIEWYVNGGRVTSAQVFANTSGDAELASCIVGKIKRWTFPLDVEGEVNYPFIFKPKN